MNFLDAIEGAAWGGFSLYEGINCVEAAWELSGLEGGSPDLDQRVTQVKQRIAVSGASATGFATYTLLWANRVKWIALGALTPFIGAIGYGSRIFLSGFSVWEACTQLDFEGLKKAEHEQIEILLKLIKHVAFLAWAFFALLALMVGPVLLPVVEITMLLSLLLLLVEMSYRQFIKPQVPSAT